MIVLALDTALAACSVAVVEDGRALAALSEPMTRGHQERLAPMVAEAMTAAGLRFDRLDRVAVTTGPGSFTGLRVGLAFARTLALARSLPCVGITTLEVLAGEAPGSAVAAIAAPHGRLYLQAFGGAKEGPELVSLEDAEARIRHAAPDRLVGPAAKALAAWAPHAQIEPLAAPEPVALARLAAARPTPAEPPPPVYLRPVDARTLVERGLA